MDDQEEGWEEEAGSQARGGSGAVVVVLGGNRGQRGSHTVKLKLTGEHRDAGVVADVSNETVGAGLEGIIAGIAIKEEKKKKKKKN